MPEHQPQHQNPLAAAGAARLVVFAPNWLGDAVMALPALADVRRASPEATIAVAARPSIAPLFEMADGVQEIVMLNTGGSWWRDHSGPLRDGRFDAALLLPNSFHAAYLAWRAGIRERWGYATDWRGSLLTRTVPPPKRVHQASFYQHLVRTLGFPSGALEPAIDSAGVIRGEGRRPARSGGMGSPRAADGAGARRRVRRRQALAGIVFRRRGDDARDRRHVRPC